MLNVLFVNKPYFKRHASHWACLFFEKFQYKDTLAFSLRSFLTHIYYEEDGFLMLQIYNLVVSKSERPSSRLLFRAILGD